MPGSRDVRTQALVRTPRSGFVALCVLAVMLGFGGSAASAAGAAPSRALCFVAAGDALEANDWPALVTSFEHVVMERPDFFPEPMMASESAVTEDAGRYVVGISAEGGHLSMDDCDQSPAGTEWSAMVPRSVLIGGAQRILDGAKVPPQSGGDAPIPDDAETEVTIGLDTERGAVRTTIDFSIQRLLTISGSCWIDDVLVLGTSDSWPTAEATTGTEGGPLAEPACARFRDYMVDGGAGERALTLLPAQVTLPHGASLVLRVRSATVTSDGIGLEGDVVYQ